MRNYGTLAAKLSMEDVKKIMDLYTEEAGFEYQHAYFILEDATVVKANFDHGIELVSFLVSAVAVLPL